ncbi:hypothetical protein RhiJN_08028 [Ceratobasidium sp. AG-Ba]|nr:hypothetical protein RhiJN_08028 [Ceratobasidium sp. AG-Ba]
MPTFPLAPSFDVGYFPYSEYKSYGHIRQSTSAIWSEYEKWTEYIHPNGSLYWTCYAYPGRVVSDVKPPLSALDTRAPQTISRIMDGLGEVPSLQDYHNWEIYTDGHSCVYIDHGSRAASNGFESLSDFRAQIQKLKGNMNIKTNRVLFKQSNAPFSQDDAREMTDLIKTVAGVTIGNNRLASHYGQNDAREIRRKEKAEDVESNMPYGSLWNKLSWYLITSLLFGIPQRYLRRINNVDRTQSGNGVNTLRWRSFLKSLCKEWTDSNLLVRAKARATVALLAIQGLNGITVITSLVAALHALSSVLSGMLLVSNHQDRVESFGITGAKSRISGTVRPLAILLSLPVAFMLWGMLWFIFAVVSCAYDFPQSGRTTPFPITAVRITSLLFLCILSIIGAVLLWFYHGIWKIPASVELQVQPQSTTADMVTGQGGNPVMSFSGDQPPGKQPLQPVLHAFQPGPNSPAAALGIPPQSQVPAIAPMVIDARPDQPASVAMPPPPNYALPAPPPTRPPAGKDEATLNQMATDIRRECEKHGQVRDVQIPKRSPLAQVSITFDSQASASKAFAAFKDSGLVGYQLS